MNKFRTELPDKSEFTGSFPRIINAIAAVGIDCNDDYIHVHWRIITFWHRGGKFKVYADTGTNEYGVEFEVIKWMPLEDMPHKIQK